MLKNKKQNDPVTLYSMVVCSDSTKVLAADSDETVSVKCAHFYQTLGLDHYELRKEVFLAED